MTLTTRVAIIEPTPVRAVFDECRRIIGAQDATFRHDVPAQFYDDGRARYGNDAGQGFAALLWAYYGVESPLMPDDESEYDEEDRSNWPSPTGWSIEVAFDTTYGYKAENGARCSDLHAWIVRELGRWLDDRGLTWLWYHEYTGEWHASTVPITLLGDPERGTLRTPVAAARTSEGG